MKQSAGCLLYRLNAEGAWEVLIVHPSGIYNRRAPWSIPKGLVDQGETTEATARRETLEETGVIAGELVSLGFVDLKKSRKRFTVLQDRCLRAHCRPAHHGRLIRQAWCRPKSRSNGCIQIRARWSIAWSNDCPHASRACTNESVANSLASVARTMGSN